DLLPLRSVMEARRTHRQWAVHGGGHGAAEGVVPHRVHPAPDCAVELHNALHRAADIVGGVPGVTVGMHEYLAPGHFRPRVEPVSLTPERVVDHGYPCIPECQICQVLPGPIGRPPISDHDVEIAGIVLGEAVAHRHLDVG